MERERERKKAEREEESGGCACSAVERKAREREREEEGGRGREEERAAGEKARLEAESKKVKEGEERRGWNRGEGKVTAGDRHVDLSAQLSVPRRTHAHTHTHIEVHTHTQYPHTHTHAHTHAPVRLGRQICLVHPMSSLLSFSLSLALFLCSSPCVHTSHTQLDQAHVQPVANDSAPQAEKKPRHRWKNPIVSHQRRCLCCLCCCAFWLTLSHGDCARAHTQVDSRIGRRPLQGQRGRETRSKGPRDSPVGSLSLSLFSLSP